MDPHQRYEDEAISLHESINTALNISLIVEKICSFLSPSDLLVFRLVNRVFHAHATRQLRVVGHKPIKLMYEDTVDKFITLMKTRLDLDAINAFPFTAFQLNLRHSAEILEQFVIEAGQHVHRLKVGERFPIEREFESDKLEQKLTMLLNHTPNIAGIDIFTYTQLHMSNVDIAAFPKSLPRLTDIKVDSETWKPPPPDSTPLLSLLITRAPLLEYVHNVGVEDTAVETRGMRALQALSQHHNLRAPLLKNGTVYLRPQALHVLQELKNLSLRVQNLKATVNLDDNTIQTNAIPSPNFILQQLSSWLTILSSNLKYLGLHLSIHQPHESVTFIIPKLPACTEFKCWFFLPDKVSTRLDITMAPNAFPSLRSLDITIQNENCLEQSRVVTFDWPPLPSVQKLQIHISSFLMEFFSWHRILPNLNSLTLLVTQGSAVACRANVSFVLRHFPRIKSLDLCFDLKYGHDSDFWDILTGEAIRPTTKYAPIYGKLEHAGKPENPVEGVYQTSSLGNLTALTTLKWTPVSRANLDAILFMTRVGRLGPLNDLDLTTEDKNMKVSEMKAYRDVLAQVHTQVSLSRW